MKDTTHVLQSTSSHYFKKIIIPSRIDHFIAKNQFSKMRLNFNASMDVGTSGNRYCIFTTFENSLKCKVDCF